MADLAGRGLYIGVVALAVVNISTASILVRLAGVHGFVAASWRLIIATIITLAALLLLEGVPRRPSTRDLFLMTASGVFLALHFGLWMMSLFHLYVAPSVTIVDSYPALLAIVGRLVFKEEYGPGQLLGAGLAMAGVAGLSLHSSGGGLAPPGGDPVTGVVLAFAGMLCVAGYFIIGKSLRSRYSTLEYTLVVYGVASVVASTVAYLLGYSLAVGDPETAMYLVLLALLPMLGGHTLINYVLPRLSLLAATVPVLGEPVGAGILAWLVLGETVDAGTAAFMAVTLTGIGLVLVLERSE